MCERSTLTPWESERDGKGGQRTNLILTSSAAGSPARTYRWPVDVQAFTESEAASGLNFTGSCPSCAPRMFSLRTSPDSYPAVGVRSASISEYSSGVIIAGVEGLVAALRAEQGHSFIERIRDTISASSSPDWRNSGTAFRGRYWTHDTSASRRAAAACSLSQVLIPDAPKRYSVSPKAARGILRRAARRGKTLPAPLAAALEAVAATPTA